MAWLTLTMSLRPLMPGDPADSTPSGHEESDPRLETPAAGNCPRPVPFCRRGRPGRRLAEDQLPSASPRSYNNRGATEESRGRTMVLAILAALATTALWMCLLCLGVVLAWKGLRGGLIDNEPRCRRCRYILISLSARPAICPECGADVTFEEAVIYGCQRRRPALAMLGVMIVLLALSPVTLLVVSKAPVAGGPGPAARPVIVARGSRVASVRGYSGSNAGGGPRSRASAGGGGSQGGGPARMPRFSVPDLPIKSAMDDRSAPEKDGSPLVSTPGGVLTDIKTGGPAASPFGDGPPAPWVAEGGAGGGAAAHVSKPKPGEETGGLAAESQVLVASSLAQALPSMRSGSMDAFADSQDLAVKSCVAQSQTWTGTWQYGQGTTTWAPQFGFSGTFRPDPSGVQMALPAQRWGGDRMIAAPIGRSVTAGRVTPTRFRPAALR